MSPIAVALSLALQAQVAANPPPKVVSPNFLPMEIRRAVNEANTLCKESGGKPGQSSKLIKFVDLTGDGVIDYVMDLAFYDCEGAASAMSAGQSGNAITVFVGGPNNSATRAYQGVSQGTEIVTVAGKPRLHLVVMGADCGQKHSAKRAFSDVAVCTRPLNWDGAKRQFVLAPLREVRPFRIQ